MKLGEVLKQERERRQLSIPEIAERLGVEVAQYEAIEAGEDSSFEAIGALVLGFNELIEGQVNQLFYPCGLPFTEVRAYDVSVEAGIAAPSDQDL